MRSTLHPPNTRYYWFFDSPQQEAMIHRHGLWGSIGGVLTIADLEARLLEDTTEVIAVRFIVGEVLVEEDRTLLVAGEGDFGFPVIVPQATEAFDGLCVQKTPVGQRLEVIGILQGDARIGPCMTATDAGQRTFGTDSVPAATAPDSP